MFLVNSISGGGAELASRIISSRLNSVHFHSSFVAINDWPDDKALIPCEVFRLGRKYKGSMWNLFLSILKFRSLIREQKPDFLVINCELPEFFSLAAPRASKRIVVEHTSKPWSHFRFLGFIVRKYLSLTKATWVSVSQNREIWGINSKAAFQISNPIVHDLPSYSNKIKRINRLFFVGRLNSIKQPDLILQASKLSGIPGILIGDGPERQSLQSKIIKEDLDVVLAGHSLEPWSEFTAGDLVVIPSLYEGDGLVISEAIIIGAPILLMNVPDLRRFDLSDENYFEDFSDFLQKITKYSMDTTMLNPKIEIRLSQITERSTEFVLKKWEQLLLDLAGTP
jgi:glycosyltransferase involved in cell wall biosynthesis